MIIAGASGHAREILDILDLKGVDDIWFFDNVSESIPNEISNENIIRDESTLREFLCHSNSFILGTGGPNVRRVLFDLFIRNGGKPELCVAHTVTISQRSVDILEGCNIMHHVLISNHVRIGKGSLINAGAQVHHDVSIGNFCEIGPSALILGKVKIGDSVMVGAGAILMPNIEIGNGATIGAGAVVTKKVDAGKTVKGNPAK